MIARFGTKAYGKGTSSDQKLQSEGSNFMKRNMLSLCMGLCLGLLPITTLEVQAVDQIHGEGTA